MSRPGRRGSAGLVLVFGESRNDSLSIQHLLVLANGRLDGRIRAVPRPVSLTRQAGRGQVRDWVAEIRRAITGYEAGGQHVLAALVHRDADGPDPDAKVEAGLRRDLAPLGCAHPVVPVQMTEAWWFLFPDAVEAVRPGAWRGTVPRKPRDVELITNPKRELQRLTGKRKKASYSEAESPKIAEQVRQQRLAPLGTSASYRRFCQLARSLT